MEILSKLVEIIIYVAIGIIFCIIGYKATEKIYKKSFNLTEEIDNHNKAAGIMVSGMFIAIAIIMSGVL
ncbi:MAG: DUF350 domain-containing protein [Clostridia bacterium]|nr:DUF350 domain-containing protein [Clostridia bacterium]